MKIIEKGLTKSRRGEKYDKFIVDRIKLDAKIQANEYINALEARIEAFKIQSDTDFRRDYCFNLENSFRSALLEFMDYSIKAMAKFMSLK